MPVKTFVWVAVALEFLAHLTVGRTMRIWRMPVADLIEEVDLVLVKHQACCNRVDRCVSPSLIKESSVLIEYVKEVRVRLGSQPGEASDFEV